jgi:hypothetical protein
MEVTGATGAVARKKVFRAHLEIAGRQFTAFPVIGLSLTVGLVGRDILNHFVTTLDGPRKDFSIE